MKTKSIKFLMAGLLGFSGVSLAAFAVKATKTEEPVLAYSPSTTYTNGDAATYYNDISDVKTGDALLADLYTLNRSRRKTQVGYSTMGTSVSGAFAYTDYDPANVAYDAKGQVYGTKVLSFYSGTPSTSWNREHVWPASRMPGGRSGNIVDDDIYMPRPTISSENSSRGNSVYYEGREDPNDGWDPIKAFGVNGCYKGTSIRGECARIIFYCLTVDNRLVLNQSTSNSGDNMGILTDLLKWNIENPVNEREKNRNEGGEYLQGNRNAFVDHPEYACKIWGNYNEQTRKICGSQQEAPTQITLSGNTTVGVGGKSTLTVTVDKGSDAVIWDSSDKTVATVKDGVVTGLKAGTSVISASSAMNPNVIGKLTITVKALSELKLEGTPTKTTYNAGQTFDPTGLTVTAKYSDNSEAVVTSQVDWQPSPLYAGLTSVTGKYGGKSVVVNGLTVNKAAAQESVKISFKNSSSDGSAEISASDLKALVETGADNVSSMSDVTKCYPGKTGVKLGSSSKTGGFTVNLKTQIEGVTDIKITSAKYGSDSSTLSINGKEIDIGESVSTGITGNVSSVSVKAIGKRAYIKSIDIMCNSGGGDDDDTIHVTNVELDAHSAELDINETKTLTATVSPANATNKEVTWSSSDETVASVANGVVTAKGPGVATITVKSKDGNITDECVITVKGGGTDTVPVESIALDITEVTLKPEESFTLMVTINPTNATNKEVTWSSSDSTVVSVNNGTVTALKEGVATITATTVDGNKTATCKITVSNSDTPTPTPKKGCQNSIVASSAIVTITAALGLVLLSIKKKHE